MATRIEPSRLPHVQITADRPGGTSAKILLDGQPVPGVTAVEVHMSVTDVHRVTLHLIAGAVDIDAPALVEARGLLSPRREQS